MQERPFNGDFTPKKPVEHGERDPMKSVRMPNRDDMVRRLNEAGGLLGISPQTDKFYGRFVDSVADSSKVGMGLNIAWELATYDTLSDLPPIIAVQVGLTFDRAIDAVTPDPEVASNAKQVRLEILEEMRRENEHGQI